MTVPDPGRTSSIYWIGAGATAAMLVIVAAAGAWLWTDRVRTIEAGERSVSALVRVLEEQAARSFEAVDLTLLGMIDAMRLNPSLPAHDAKFEESMRQWLRLLPYVRALYVIGPDGFITQDTDHPKTPQVSLADRDYFQAHAKDPSLSLHIGQPLISRSLGTWFVSVSRRLDGPNGRSDGIAIAAVEPRYFERFYRDLHLGERDSIGLFRRDGIVMVRGPHRDGAIGTDWSENEVFRVHLPTAPSGTYRSISLLDREDHIFSYRSLETYPLVVAVGLAEADLLAGWWRSVAVTGAVVSALTLLILALTSLWVKRQSEMEQAVHHRIQAQKLEALGRMTGGVAHDFNNLMAVVASGLRLIRGRIDNEEVRRIADTASAAVERGTRLTQQMLAFARQQELTVVRADLNEQIAGMEDLLRNAAGPAVDMVIDVGSDLPPCLTDQTQFDTALLNLVVNARDAMPSGGTIRIATWRCANDDARRMPNLKLGPYACVTVADTGQGMPSDVLKRALEPFFTTKGSKGTGLGLSQVYGFVRQSGGDVRVASQVGVGTTIDLFFPGLESRGGSS
ncbi:signal transduction histidine kinase [Skermanella aerolata]|uniref:hybrid sensor histidine kinase/response regulator n=1 Tax=Skermanella aerolata TaxID=393310 RepID=UPI003D1CC286